MNDSGLWKRGLVLLALVALIAGMALWATLWRQTPVTSTTEPICPEFLTQMICSPASASVAPFPASINWGVLYQLGQSAPSSSGWQIRYNATLALARKGQLQETEHFDTVCEMLDERQQLFNFSLCQKNGKMTADESAARRTVLNALQAVGQWYPLATKFAGKNAETKKAYDAGLARITQAVEQLTQSPNQVLHTEALKTLQVLQGK
jgi:hypothetical protein